MLRFIDVRVSYPREGKQRLVAASLRAVQFQSCILNPRLLLWARNIMRQPVAGIEFVADVGTAIRPRRLPLLGETTVNQLSSGSFDPEGFL